MEFNQMYSKLQFNVNGEVIEFSAHELIMAAHQVTQEMRATVDPKEVLIPDYASMEKRLTDDFWNFNRSVCSKLDEYYRLKEGRTEDFLRFAHDICLNEPQSIISIVAKPANSELLDHVKNQSKAPLIDFNLSEQVVIPASTIKPTNLQQWMWIATHFKDPGHNIGAVRGWWLCVGGRIIRLRNDRVDGHLPESNKQLYAADHGTVTYIMTQARAAIARCLKNFTWSDEGSYIQAFNFWMYYELYRYDDLKIEFIEKVGGLDLKDEISCRNVFLSLGRQGVNRELLMQKVVVPVKHRGTRETLFQNTLLDMISSSRKPLVIVSVHEDWLKNNFMAQLTDEMIQDYLSYDNQKRMKLKKDCEKMLAGLFYQLFRPAVIPFHELSQKEKSDRAALFGKFLEQKRQQHHSSLKTEFLALMNEDIAASPLACIRLLISLGSVYPEFRGIVNDENWAQVKIWHVGEREYLDSPSVQPEKLDEAKRRQYEAIYDGLIEDFRYVTEAVLKQHVQSMFDRHLNPFFTQVKQIMHPQDAEQYLLAYTLQDLAKSINRGQHEPILRELTAYGDPDAGDSYHKFEISLLTYFKSPDAMTEAKVASIMRKILVGFSEVPEQLAFLPALTAAWFISESSRNDITTMTTLMLLDFIESHIFLDCGNGSNWYTWSHSLIHPLKTSGDKDVNDLYGKKCKGIDRFGGCHPMVNQGSVAQTEALPNFQKPLTISRQKEGHLLVHWLEQRVISLSEADKIKFHIHGVKCLKGSGSYAAPKKKDDMVDEIEKIKKAREKDNTTVAIKKKKNPNDSAEKYLKSIGEYDEKIMRLEADLRHLERIEQIKETLLNDIILPQFRRRLSTVENLLTPTAVLAEVVISDPISKTVEEDRVKSINTIPDATPDSADNIESDKKLSLFFDSFVTEKKASSEPTAAATAARREPSESPQEHKVLSFFFESLISSKKTSPDDRAEEVPPKLESTGNFSVDNLGAESKDSNGYDI